jgi:hypothetical protein
MQSPAASAEKIERAELERGGGEAGVKHFLLQIFCIADE